MERHLRYHHTENSVIRWPWLASACGLWSSPSFRGPLLIPLPPLCAATANVNLRFQGYGVRPVPSLPTFRRPENLPRGINPGSFPHPMLPK